MAEKEVRVTYKPAVFEGENAEKCDDVNVT